MGRPKSVFAHDIERAKQEGFDEGLAKGRQEILDWLEHAYIKAPNRPDRGSVEGEAILQLARDASNHFKSQTKSKKGSKK